MTDACLLFSISFAFLWGEHVELMVLEDRDRANSNEKF